MNKMTTIKKRVISPDLIKAYRLAIYEVHTAEQVIPLRIGEVNHQLVARMKDVQCTTAAYLTACNPYSEQRTKEENLVAQEKLLADLDSLQCHFLHGEGRDEARVWPPEPSVLALGITLQDAEMLADRYEQNAFVWIGNLDGFVSLRLRHPIAIPSLDDAAQWIRHLPSHLQPAAHTISLAELAWLMATPDKELDHWLHPESWDLNQPWPLARPDGSAMGVGSELDRVFRLIHAGVQSFA